MISVNMVNAIKVQFLQPIFGEDFVEKGMIAWLTDIVWDDTDCYKLFFDFSEFESQNQKYFTEGYYPNAVTRHNPNLPVKSLYTALEAGYYTPKYSVYFSTGDDNRNDELFAIEIAKYLKEVDMDKPFVSTTGRTGGEDVSPMVGDLVHRLGEYYSFNNGDTALYHHLMAVVQMHIKEPLK